MFRLLLERAEDAPEVEMLYDLAFAPGRTGLSSYRLRDGIAPLAPLCWLARDDFDAVAGAIRYWPIRVGEGDASALLLGPVAVHPTRQGEGLGALLIARTLDVARKAGWQRVVLVGDEPYYGRFGFRKAGDRICFPPPTNPARVLALPLVAGAFDDVSGAVRRWDGRQP